MFCKAFIGDYIFMAVEKAALSMCCRMFWTFGEDRYLLPVLKLFTSEGRLKCLL